MVQGDQDWRLETVWEDEDEDEEKTEEEERWEVGGAGVCDVILPGGLTQGSPSHTVTQSHWQCLRGTI